jgi:hypothetical protein
MTLIQTDNSFTPLIFKAINLNDYLQCNLLEADDSVMKQAADLLRCFSQLPEFCANLYEILVVKIEGFTQVIPS